MTTTSDQEKTPFVFAPGFWTVVALGGLIGYLLAGDMIQQPYYFLLGSFCAGIAWAYLFVQWTEILADSIALLKSPIPTDLNIADRSSVTESLEGHKGNSIVSLRVRNLLKCWVEATNARQVIELASFQSAQAFKSVIAGTVFALILLVIGVFLYANPWAIWGGFALLALTVYTRQTLLSHIDRYIEFQLLSRLPGNIPQTAMTASDLAEALGGSIEKAFKNHVPQPEATAEAMKGAVDNVVTRVAEQVEKLQQVLVQSQSSLVDRWTHAAEKTNTDLKDVEASLSTIVNDLTGGLSTNADKLNSMFSTHTKEMDRTFGALVEQLKKGLTGDFDKLKEVLSAHAEEVRGSGGDWGGKIKGVLSEHVNSIEAANHELADQLEKIATLEKNIENVLKIQEVVDGTLKTVAASEEFSKLISALREHLEQSDNLLREVSKPRTIRLVETEGEVEEMPAQEKASTSAPKPSPDAKPDTEPESKNGDQ